jgi:protein arginine kinase activator
MKCTHCHEKEANTHIKRIINGKKEELHLCEDCAKELGVMKEFEFEPLNMNSLFGNLLGAGAAALNSLAGVERCNYCGSSFNDIVNSGKVGCANCYDKFEDRLAPSIEKLHGRTKHVGKYVTYSEDSDKVNKQETKSEVSEIDKLKAEMQAAIKEQRFEDAAIIRDKINGLTKED